MKKALSVLIVCLLTVLTLSLAACAENDGTYYPDERQMKANLENSGYTVSVTADLGDKSGTKLEAENGREYLYFYWLDNAADCQYYYDLSKEQCKENYNSLVKIENDKKYGNLVYCGTKSAVDAAGIVVVKVKV